MQGRGRIAWRNAALLGAVALSLISAARAETLLVVRRSAAALDFIDPGSGLRLATVAVGSAPHEVAVSPDGAVAVVSNDGTRDAQGPTISVIDLAHPRELRRIELGTHIRPHGIAWLGPDRVAVTSDGTGQVLLLDPYAGRVLDAPAAAQENIPPEATATGTGSASMTPRPGAGQLWVPARQEGSLAIVDTRTQAVVARVSLPGVPTRVAFNAGGTRAYVMCPGIAEIVVLDAQTLAVLRTLTVDGEPDGLALTNVLPQAKCHACVAPPEPKPAAGMTH